MATMGWIYRVSKLQVAWAAALLLALFLLTKRLCWVNHRRGKLLSSKEVQEDGSVKLPMSVLVEGPFELSQEDPFLIDYIKRQMKGPAEEGSSLWLAKPITTGQIGQALEVVDYYAGKRAGVFVEAGAWDGEYLSNTLYLETNYTWTGLLVEPNQDAFRLLEKRNRKAKAISSCLSVKRHPEKVEFDAADVFGGIDRSVEAKGMEHMRDSIPKNMRSKYSVQCFPLYSLLLAAGLQRVDLLSLDIEGAEQAVLETLPWDKLDIGMVMIEVEHSDRGAIDKLMTNAGYKVHKKLGLQDIIYVKQ